MTENMAARGEGLAGAIEGALKEASVFCLACAKGEKVVVPPRSSIVGKAAVHSSGMICVPGTVRALIEERITALEAAAPAGTAHNEQIRAALHSAIDHAVYDLPSSESYIKLLRDAETAALATPSPQASLQATKDETRGDVCEGNAPRLLAESPSTFAATQEPAGSGGTLEIVERLQITPEMVMDAVNLADSSRDEGWWEACANRLNVLLESKLESLERYFGSPRKVGEDAPYYVGPCSCCDGRQWEIWSRQGVPLRWSSSDKELVESVCELLNSLIFPSSVPVGEQKQEEGV